MAKGPLGALGSQWLMIDSIFFIMGAALWLRSPKGGPALQR
jgi:hypothetical protein